MSDSGTSSGPPTMTAPVPPAPPTPPRAPSSAPSGPPRGGPRRRPGGGIIAGIILIVLGLAFLAGPVLPGVSVWTLWPLLIVIAGIVQAVTPGRAEGWSVYRLAEGIGTVLFGLVLLGCTTGYIAWTVWWTFITLWPALLIALGLVLIGNGTSQHWLRLLGSVVVWATLLYAAAASLTGATAFVPTGVLFHAGTGTPFEMSEPLGGASSASLDFSGAAGDVSLDAGHELIHVSGASPFGKPVMTTTRAGNRARVTLNMGGSGGTWLVVPGVGGSTVDVELSRSALWDATLQTGATNLRADLSDVHVRSLELRTGASSSSIKLGRVPDGVVDATLLVKAGVASVRILIPKGTEARIDTTNGLANATASGDFVKHGTAWETPGYSAQSKHWTITTQSGLSAVNVSTY